MSMKFLLAKLSLVFFLSACASPTRSSKTAVLPPHQATLTELQQDEFSRPQDPQVKAALGRTYWCHNEKGRAVEHWRWLAHFAPTTPEATSAQEYLLLIKEGKESKVGRVLKCE